MFWVGLFVLSLLLQYVVALQPKPVIAAVNQAAFELDGNAVTSTSDDWDHVFAHTSSATSTVFINDGFGAGDDIYTGGSTKDDIDLSSWLWKVGSVQDKNDIENAFAAAYTVGGTSFAYFGLDRYQTSGDATAGFWFLKNAVGKTGDGSGNGSPFSGVHAEGDILVVLDFSNGGATATAVVYVWHNGALVQKSSGNKCTPSSTDDVCAISNTSDATSPWPFTPKDTKGTANVFPGNALFEGGLNLTGLGLDTGCFTSFLSETRSSNTPSSTLSDFAWGQFSFCAQPRISTTLSDTSVSVGAAVHDSATLTNPTSNAGGTVTYTVYDNSACSGTGIDAGTKTVSNGVVPDSDPVTFNTAGTYYWQAAYSGDQRNLAATSACTDEILTVVQHPAISITKLPATQTIDSGDTANWKIVVSNTGDVPLTQVSVADELAPLCNKTFDGTLAVGASEPEYSCSLANVTANFTNVAIATGKPPVGDNVSNQASAAVVVRIPSPGPGSLRITKVVDGDTAGFPGGTFSFAVDCLEGNRSVTLGAGVLKGSVTVDDIAAGTQCSVVENTPLPGAGTNASWSGTSYSTDGSVTIVDGQIATVTVTNHRTVTQPRPGSLEITKAITGTSVGFPGGDFGIDVTCSGMEGAIHKTITIAASGSSGSATVDNLADGTTCSVSEVSKPDPGTYGAWGAVAYSTQPVTIASGQTATITVTNPRTYNPPCTVNCGGPTPGLAISKFVSLSATGPWTDHSLTTTVGTTVWYRVHVDNTGSAPLSGLTVVDSLGLPATCPAVSGSTLATAGGNYECIYSRTAVAGTTTNTATADSDQTSPVTDTANVTAPTPSGSVAGATGSPKPTPPSTDTNGQSNGGGLNFTLVLLGLAGLMALLGIVTPAPARKRSRY